MFQESFKGVSKKLSKFHEFFETVSRKFKAYQKSFKKALLLLSLSSQLPEQKEGLFSWLPVNQGRVSQISCEIYVIHGQFYP